MKKYICIKEFTYSEIIIKVNTIFTEHIVGGVTSHVYNITDNISIYMSMYDCNKYLITLEEFRELRLNKIING